MTEETFPQDDISAGSTQSDGGPPGPVVKAQENVSKSLYANGENPKLRYCKPYWWPYRTFVKERWEGRRLLEVVSTEFRDRSVEYYKHALECGVTKVNGVIASPDLILKGNDRLDNTVHRHEPPITNDKILILHRDDERQFIVISKPGSIPVHPTGRYYRNTILELLKADYGIHAHAVNRLDRLTSGLMILALTGSAARDLADEFFQGKVKKQYVARVKGKFTEEEITVDQNLLTIDRQMGLVVIAPEGKEAVTIFKRLSYDAERDQSVVLCRPQTGRTHQIRVHLQYLGHPIANDPLYGLSSVWGPDLGKGGVELVRQPTISHLRTALESRQATNSGSSSVAGTGTATPKEIDANDASGSMTPQNGDAALHDREGGNIDLASPILLSQQAKDIIRKLRRKKDEQEDWVKWKEVVFSAKAAQDSMEARMATLSPRDGSVDPLSSSLDTIRTNGETPAKENASSSNAPNGSSTEISKSTKESRPRDSNGRTIRRRKEKPPPPEALPDDYQSLLPPPEYLPPGFCAQCFVPLPDDPDPEDLFIYLHAQRYETEQLGAWETPLPRWAGANWDGDWRGWEDSA